MEFPAAKDAAYRMRPKTWLPAMNVASGGIMVVQEFRHPYVIDPGAVMVVGSLHPMDQLRPQYSPSYQAGRVFDCD